MARRGPSVGAVALLALLLAPSVIASGAPGSVEPPVLSTHLEASGVVPAGPVTFSARPGPHVVDGRLDDWQGASAMLGGAALYDRGEYIDQDYVFDDRGADDGKDAARLAALAPAERADPRTERLQTMAQAVGVQFGLRDKDPTGGDIAAGEAFGDAVYPPGAEGHADLLEVRVAADATRVWLLARTATMLDPGLTALLLLADTGRGPGGDAAVPFGSGVHTRVADLALLVTRDGVRAALVGSAGAVTWVPDAQVIVQADGYANAVEVGLPRGLLEHPGEAGEGPTLRLALAAGVPEGDGLAQVAQGEGRAELLDAAFFAETEPSIWMEKSQALALLGGDLDGAFARIDLGWLERGASQPVAPAPGYHERVFASSEAISEEQGLEGVHQIYGLYVPTAWRPGEAAPLTFWLPWRSSSANTHAAWAPNVALQLGEDRGSLVVSPRARGPTSWYVGKGHQDFLEVWDDVHRDFRVDADRTYVAGVSMGGFGAYLLSMLYPDRFAGAFVIAGAMTQGAWLGLDEAQGADTIDQNEGDASAELVMRLAENLRNVPLVAYQSPNDQAVPASGVARFALRLTELGYRHRVYWFPGTSHESGPILDTWTEAAAYLDAHPRTGEPGRVVYKRVPALERAVETVYAGGATLRFAFDGASWLSGLEVRDPRPDDLTDFALADVTTLALPEDHAAVPEVGASAQGQPTPYVMQGLRWQPLPGGAPRNAFTANLTHVAQARLDLARMGLAPDRALEAAVTTDGPVRLLLAAAWATPPRLLLDGAAAPAEVLDGALVLVLPAGDHIMEVAPSGAATLRAPDAGIAAGVAVVAVALATRAARRRP